MRKHLATVVVVAGLVACSSDSRNPAGLSLGEASPVISDATSAGREGFYFLHPIVTKPGVAGPFDGALAPRARVCALDASYTTCSSVVPGTANLSVDPANGVFAGQWSTASALQLTTVAGTETRYRLEIQLDVGTRTVTLGYADLWILAQQRDVSQTPPGYVDLVQGKTLIFRFGILPGTVGYVVVTPDPTEVPIGGTQQMTAFAYDLHNAAMPSATFAWSSDDISIAAVSSSGLATGLANGSTNINAKTKGVTGSAVINVVGDPPVAATAVADEPSAESAPGDPFHGAFNMTLSSGASTPGLLDNDVLGSPPATLVSFGGGSLGGSVGSNAAGATVNFGTDGSLTVNGDGSFSFTPSTAFTGLFSFTYRIQNSSGPSEAPVSIAVGSRPSASDDVYPATIIGNVSINTATNSNFSVLGNDAGDGVTINLGASPNGDVTFNADGTFTFNPSPGFTGTAIFSYTLQNGLGTSPSASVSIAVTTPIWFVNASAPAGGDGRLSSPFNCLVDAGSDCYDDSANEAGDFIYIASGTYANSGALSLKATQRIIGQGAASSLATLTGLGNAADSPSLPSTGGVAPLISSSASGIVLASNNQLHGFNVGNTDGAGLSGDGFGTLTLRDVNFPGPARSGQALGLANGTLAAGSAFKTIVSTSGADVGISVVNVAGIFAVTGDGTAESGGTIANTTGASAVVLSGLANVSLSRMVVRDNAGNGINATNIAGFSLSNSVLRNNGDDASEANIRMSGLSGAASIASSTISNASGDNVVVEKASGTLTFSLAGSALSNVATEPDALNGVLINATGTATVTASITTNTFQGHRFGHLNVNSANSAGVTINVVGNTMECGNAAATRCNASFVSGSDGPFTYTVQSNVMTGMKAPVTLNKNFGTGAMNGSFSSNSIGATGVAGSGGEGLSLLSQVDGAIHATSVANNSIRGYKNIGIDLSAAAGLLFATVSANVFEEPDETAQHGVRATAGTTPASAALMCLQMSNNLLNGSGPVSDFSLVQGGLATMLLPFYGGANSDNNAVVAFVRGAQALNDATNPTGSASNTVGSGGGGFIGGAACSSDEGGNH